MFPFFRRDSDAKHPKFSIIPRLVYKATSTFGEIIGLTEISAKKIETIRLGNFTFPFGRA